MITQKVAILTAAGSGMGAAAAEQLSADDFKVAILSHSGKGEALAKIWWNWCDGTVKPFAA